MAESVLNRRSALLGIAGAFAARAEIQYPAYHRCLPDFLAALAREAYARRERALAGLTTAEAIRNRQRWVTETFWALVGGRPEPSPLNLKVVGEIARDGYRMEKIVYESLPGLVIPANLYVPAKRSGPFPGVLFQAGHSLNGKAAEPYQKCCQALAKLGYVVLAPDPMGQGERTYYPAPDSLLTRLGSADEEHSRPGRQMLLVGDTATRMQTWDAVRSLDVLASHPLVDRTKLASTGQSGGGTLTMFLAAVDDRLACAAVSCGNTENHALAAFNAPGSTDDAEQNFVNAGPLGFDRWDTLYPLAPKPLWIGVSARDWFGTYSPDYLVSGRAEYAKLRAVYQRLGRGGAIEWYETPVPHALSHDLRVRIYAFFEKHLRGGQGSVLEPAVRPEPDAAVQVGKSGSVVRDFGSRTPRQIARERLSSLRPVGAWSDLLRVLRSSAKPRVFARANAEGCNIEGIDVQSEPGVFVPAWLFVPKSGSRDRVLLALEPRGRNGRWREDDLYHRLAAQGWTVCAFDVRGLGDMWPEVGRGNPFYTRPHTEEEHYAWASLMLGRPLLGQRVTDILAIAAALRGTRTVLAASGHTTVPAICAAVLDKGIDLLYTSGGLRSWASLLDVEDYAEPFANFLPGILTRIDLPELRAQLGPRLKEGTKWDLDTLASL
jgi:dienelactone hydrolase